MLTGIKRRGIYCVSANHNEMSSTATIKTFRSKKAAEAAAEEANNAGWLAGYTGNSESGYRVNAIGYANGRTVRITYDLHEDGHFHEYSRKEVLP